MTSSDPATAMTEAARAIFRALMSARSVVITSEPYPDGDAFGAEVALREVALHAFARAGDAGSRTVRLVNEKGCPKKYLSLAGAGRIETLASVPPGEIDVGIVVDGGIERAGDARKLFERCRTKVYIDHHKMGSRERYDIVMSDPRATSTTQLIWPFFDDPEIATPLSRDAAEAIYLGLIYDTGSFQYPCTRPSTHVIAARLMEAGADFARIHERALLTQEFEDILLHGKVLAGARRLGSGREIVVASVPQALVRGTKVTGDGYDKLVQTLCFIEGSEVAVLLREQPHGQWKASLRSKGLVDVAAVARALDPDGGGHDRAAGCTLDGPEEAAVARAVALIDERVREALAKRAGG